MLDVAAVAERLIAPFHHASPIRDALVFLAALHDLGKIGDPFRAMLRHGKSQIWRHWELTEVLLHHYDATLLEPFLGSSRHRRYPLYAATAGHHGRPPTIPELTNGRLLRSLGDEAVRDAGEVIDAFSRLWPTASLAGLEMTEVSPLSWWLPGLVAAADWIGSNAGWFPAVTPGPGLDEYLTGARQRAARALTEAGLDSPPANSAPLFDFALRPMQQAARAIALPDGPSLAIIEDETGAGKTEAALLLAQRMLVAGKGRGLFFALPTTATADAMFARSSSIVARLFTAAPSLALAHGRADQSDLFRALRARTMTATDEPVLVTDWLAESRRRALLADVGVGTIDQALLSVLPTRYATLRHFALSSKILIVDEVHELGEPYMGAELERLLAAHRMAGGSAILLTATLPLAQRARLLATYGGKDEGGTAYPALTLAGGAAKWDFPQGTGRRGIVGVRRLPGSEEALDLLAETAQAGAACVWVRNAVDDAIAAVLALRERGIPAHLLHARFAMADRLRHERAALARFGKHGAERRGHILVATQVVESSLDLDFDVMVSDLAPVAALIQRAGRLWRHMDERPAASRPVAAPVLHVVSPDPAIVNDARWLSEVLDRGAWVYPVDLQWRTARVLFEAGEIIAPSGLRALIEAVHTEDGEPVPPELEKAESERIARGFAEANHARQNLINLTEGYRDGGAGAADADYPTRLGQEQRTLMLAVRDGGRLRPYAGAGFDGCQISEVMASERRLCALALPEQSDSAIQALTKDWPDWRRKAVTVCPIGEDGVICDGLNYDSKLGLTFPSYSVKHALFPAHAGMNR